MWKFFIASVWIIIGGIIGTMLTLKFGQRFFLSQSAVILQISASPDPNSTQASSTPNTPAPDIWQTVVNDAARSAVAIEVFQDAQLISSGNGVFVTTDGLLVTTADLVPEGAQYIYQIVYGDKIVRGEIVARNRQSNLALLKTDVGGFDIAEFNATAHLQSGKDLVIAGKTLDVSTPVVFAQRALIQREVARNYILDTPAKSFLNGAQALDVQGNGTGIVSLRSGKVILISSDVVTQFIADYLDKTPAR